ncbi:MAG: hypothetical protein GXP55_09760 [Deltaproteobacteria bacterium]|nr:hypothetical protein [Deltaproteobacteria bacterium]
MRNALSFLALLALPMLGCSNSHSVPPDRCDMTKVCLVTDTLGCCDGRGSEVSVCDVCPSGTVERADCRTAGCADPCTSPTRRPSGPGEDIGPAARCYQDMGSGCCGDQIFGGDVCGYCPAGSVSEYECAGFAPACGCGTTTRPAPAPPSEEPVSDAGVPPTDAGVPRADSGVPRADSGVPSDAGVPPSDAAIPPSDAGPPRALDECYTDLGPGCCGAYVGAPSECGCPPGSVTQSTCTAYSAGTGAEPPSDVPAFRAACRAILTDGGCGDIVEPNACGDCPAGSVPEWDCPTSTTI